MNGKRLNPGELNLLRKEAVSMRLQKKSLDEILKVTGLSHPTIIAAYSCFLIGGWDAVNVKPRGRPKGSALQQADELKCIHLLLNSPPEHISKDRLLWDNNIFSTWLHNVLSLNITAKSTGRYLDKWGFNPHQNVTGDLPAKKWLELHFPDNFCKLNSKPSSTSRSKPCRKKVKTFIGGIAELPVISSDHTSSDHTSFNYTSADRSEEIPSIVFIRDLRGKIQWLASSGKADSRLILDFFNACADSTRIMRFCFSLRVTR